MAWRGPSSILTALLATMLLALPTPSSAQDTEPMGDPAYTVQVDPTSGYRLYTPVAINVWEAVPRPTTTIKLPGGFDVYQEDVQAACPCPVGILGKSSDSENTTAPFGYSFQFKRFLDSRDYYVTRDVMCIDQTSEAKPLDDARPATYLVTVNDDHGQWGVVVATIRFTANVGFTGLCLNDIDTTNRYFLRFSSKENIGADEYVTGTGLVDYS